MATRKAQRPPVAAVDITPENPAVLDILLEMNSQIASMQERLARTEEKVDGINVRLDKVNGSIAKHEARFVEIKEAEAQRAVAEAKVTATKAGAEKNEAKWRKRIEKPAIFIGGAVGSAIVYFALKHGPELLTVIFHS